MYIYIYICIYIYIHICIYIYTYACASTDFNSFDNSGNTGNAGTAGETASRRGGVLPNPVTLSTGPGSGQLLPAGSQSGINSSDLHVHNVHSDVSINVCASSEFSSFAQGPSNNNVSSYQGSPAVPVWIYDEEEASFDTPCNLGRRGKVQVQVQPSREV